MGCAPSLGMLPGKQSCEFEQTIVILRHSERLDQMDPAGYKNSEEGREWPFDSPITPKGVELARKVAGQMAEIHRRVPFAGCVSSPYMRCLQTAAEVAKACNLPIMIDQELGEVWEEAMPKAGPPHRSPKQLQDITAQLGVKVKNPLLDEGGYRLFGKPPQNWPESLEQGHKRCMIRVEHYIDQSTNTRKNFIIVSHAPAVAALTDLFQRGICDISKLEYCAHVIAKRTMKEPDQVPSSPKAGKHTSVFADEWTVKSEGVAFEVNVDATESCFLRGCNSHFAGLRNREAQRSSTDLELDLTIRTLSGGGPGAKTHEDKGEL